MKKNDILLLFLFFPFSFWLMDKSFGYNSTSHTFRIARHVVGDFGLHLSLVRSISWGNNIPVESPFFPGQGLPYHYYFDFFIGLLEKIGIRIDIALNTISALLFTGILYLIYKISQIIFVKSKIVGFLSVAFFMFNSNLTFVDFFKSVTFSTFFHKLFYLPDYIHKGPFDGSIISIFFTLNVYLNQRHFIAGIFIQLLIIYVILKYIKEKKQLSVSLLLFLSLILGISSRIHTLAFFSSVIFIFFLSILFKRYNFLYLFLFPAGIIFLLLSHEFLGQNTSHQFFNPGFLAQKPLNIFNFMHFWMFNLGVVFFLIPLSYFFLNKFQKKVYISLTTLFLIGNSVQFSFLINHNHSIFNYFLLFANMYISFFLFLLLKRRLLLKITAIILFFLMVISGVINIMPIKNDFQMSAKDAPNNKFMQWVREYTKNDAIFLAKADLLDPITLSGRKNYLGAEYYLSVMGYNYKPRKILAKRFFEINDKETISRIKKENIDYIVIPKKSFEDFPYKININFLQKTFPVVYSDDTIITFKL